MEYDLNVYNYSTISLGHWLRSNLAVRDRLLMSKNPLRLHVLQKGLTKLKESIKERKDSLLACLNQREKISNEDEEWLDNSGNVVDEEAVVDLLENTSDYEHGLTWLTTQQRIIIERQKYIADINEPFACKLEGILTNFGYQTRLEDVRTIEATHITDYFTCK